MIDIHDAHHAASSWKEFFIHIATIVLGLLIAVGLEQTVEHLHHRRQVAETREALRMERNINILRFAAEAAEFRRDVPILQRDLAVFLYLQKHPAAPPAQWPNQLSFSTFASAYSDSAWTTAQQESILTLMPASEVRQDAELYRRLERLTELERERIALGTSFRDYRMDDVDESHLTSEQTARMIDQLHHYLGLWGLIATGQRFLASYYPDFTPAPSNDEVRQIYHDTYVSNDPNEKAVNLAIENMNKATEAADPNNTTGSR